MMRTPEQILIESDINTPENLAIVTEHAKPLKLAEAFELLAYYELLDQCRDFIISAINPVKTANAIIHLHTKAKALYSPEHLAILCGTTNPRHVAEAWIDLHHSQLFHLYRDAVSCHENSIRLSMGLITLHHKNLQTYAHHLLTHDKPDDLADAIYSLHCYHILDDNLQFMFPHPNPHYLAGAFTKLHTYHLLDDFKAHLLVKEYPHNLADAIVKLHTYNHLILQQYHQVLVESTNPLSLVEGIKFLNQAELLQAEHVERINTSTCPKTMALLLISLTQANLYDEARITAISARPNLGNFCQVLSMLAQAQVLNEASFEFLVHGPGQVLFSNEALTLFWNRIPAHAIPNHLEAILAATTHENTIEALETLREQIIAAERLRNLPILLGEVEPAPLEAPLINHAQSTHLSSVHRSVSESASRLKARYADIDIETTILAIRDEVNALDASHRHQVAKSAILNLCHPGYTFTDASGVSTRELLALVYTAINDEETRLGLREDGFSSFLDALYEIQRGYNIERNDPETAADSSICTGGTFNKLIEKMVGVHPDACIIFLNAQTAGLRLERFAYVEAMQYLENLASTKTAEEFENFIHVLHGIEEHGLDFIFEEFAPHLARHFFPEYETLYPLGKDDPRFLLLIEVAKDLDLSSKQINALHLTLMQSKGYQAYCSQTLMPLSINSLWARRQDNPETQHEYDKHYGLVVKP
jgi:hypothetical protein